MPIKANYINIEKANATSLFYKKFKEIFLQNFHDSYSNLIILCVGTDRSTGDSLGPLVGDRLKFVESEFIRVYGTLDEPVHAKNLVSVMERIEKRYSNPFIISIDACLGKSKNVGCIFVDKGQSNLEQG